MFRSCFTDSNVQGLAYVKLRRRSRCQCAVGFGMDEKDAGRLERDLESVKGVDQTSARSCTICP